MDKKKKKVAIYPIVYIFQSLVVALVFYVDSLVSFPRIANYTSYFFAAMFFSVALLSFFKKKYYQKMNRTQIFGLGVLVILVYSMFLWSYLSYGLSKYLISLILQFTCYGVPMILYSGYASIEKDHLSIFLTIEKFGGIVLPLAFAYLFGNIFVEGGTFITPHSIGSVNYMKMSYTIFPFFVVSYLLFIKSDAPPFFGFNKRTSDLFRIVIILIYWLTIMMASTRNTIMAVLFINLVVLICSLRNKRLFSIRRSVLLTLAITISFVFLVFVYQPKGFDRLSRVTEFINLIKEGEISTATLTDDEKESVEKLLQSIDNGSNIENEKDDASIEKNDLGKEVIIRDRGSLFRLAIKEALHNPLTGLGPLGFYYKYPGYYPHNVLLELLSECGLIIGGALVLAIIVLFTSLATDRSETFIFIFFASYIPQLMSSGTVWNSVIIWLGASYTIVRLFSTKNNKKHDLYIIS